MHEKLLQPFKKIEAKTNEFLAITQSSTPEQQLFRPMPTSWNMVEVMQHLTTTEAGILKFLHKYSPTKGSLKDAISGKARSTALNLFLQSSLKAKAPKVVTKFAPQSYEAAKESWVKTRKEWLPYLNNFSTEHHDYLAFKHPIAGKLTILQTLTFIHKHIDHHIAQLKRIQGAATYPK